MSENVQKERHEEFLQLLTMNNAKSIRYSESTYYPILLNTIYFSIFDLYKSAIGPHLKLHMSDDLQN